MRPEPDLHIVLSYKMRKSCLAHSRYVSEVWFQQPSRQFRENHAIGLYQWPQRERLLWLYGHIICFLTCCNVVDIQVFQPLFPMEFHIVSIWPCQLSIISDYYRPLDLLTMLPLKSDAKNDWDDQTDSGNKTQWFELPNILQFCRTLKCLFQSSPPALDSYTWYDIQMLCKNQMVLTTPRLCNVLPIVPIPIWV